MFPKPGPSNHRRNGANRCLLIPRYLLVSAHQVRLAKKLLCTRRSSGGGRLTKTGNCMKHEVTKEALGAHVPTRFDSKEIR